jgi:hypothetical protein
LREKVAGGCTRGPRRLADALVVCLQSIDRLDAQLGVTASIQLHCRTGEPFPEGRVFGLEPDGIAIRTIAQYVEGAFDQSKRH